jgi:putative cell wall-binding protein
MTLLDRAVSAAGKGISRRGFLSRAAMAATAIAVAPGRFLLEPRSAYAAATLAWCDSRCSQFSPGTCTCGDLCCQGWTEFCCATNPETGNTCPPGTVPGGWWRADGSGLCDVNGQPMPRYYVDCNAECAPGCGGSGGICNSNCHPDFTCGCGQDDCSYRKSACTRFRYGQCNSDVAYLGAIVCRYVSCTPPWEWSQDCSPTPVLWSNTTASHDRPCLHGNEPSGTFPGTVRLWGADRFATAVAVSQGGYPDGATQVFVATGYDFPDALSAGAVAARLGAPILLVNSSSVPSVTAAELTRLDPDVIVVLGGESAISAACTAELALYGSITRLSGGSRFETAVAISSYGFPENADAVVIATGESFADALTGAPMAARFGGPLLLTNTQNLPQSVRDEVERLDPSEIYVIGGASAVSNGVVSQLETIAPVTRVFGESRYATAVAASQEAFAAGTGRVFIAVGANYPDALAGGAAAGTASAPLLLVETNSLPQVVANEILRLSPSEAVILGGTAVISNAVEQAISGLIE